MGSEKKPGVSDHVWGSDLPEEVMGGKAPTFLDVGETKGENGGKEVGLRLRLMFLRTWGLRVSWSGYFGMLGFWEKILLQNKKSYNVRY